MRGEKNLNLSFLSGLIREKLREKNKISILEIGAGGGRNLRALHERFGASVELFGTDISVAAIRYARESGIGTFYLAASDNIPFEKKVDLILMIDVLEHLPTEACVKETLENARDHLSPGGRIYISIPIELNRFSLTWFFSKVPYLQKATRICYGHVIQFERDRFLRLIDPAAFLIQEVFYSFHFLYQVHALIFFFLPKILVRGFLGEKVSNALRDSNELMAGRRFPIASLGKSIFVCLSQPLISLAFQESEFRRGSCAGAGNMHVIVAANTTV